MHNEVNIPSKKWKCSILHKRCPFFSAEQTVRRWRSDGGRPQSDLGWLRSLTNHQHPWLARNVLSGQRNIDFKIECVHYFYLLLCTPLGQCARRKFIASWKVNSKFSVCIIITRYFVLLLDSVCSVLQGQRKCVITFERPYGWVAGWPGAGYG